MTDINSPLLSSVWWNQARQRVEVKSDVWNDERLWSSAGTADTEQNATYYQAVPWLYRAVEMRANAVASVPFRIMRGETEIAKSEQWGDELPYWPEPWRLLWLVEAALCFGPAYVWRERNSVVTKALKYVAPGTITPKIDKNEGLIGFDRNIGGVPKHASVDNVLYFWKPDYTVELGPPNATPAKAALAAAGVLYNVDVFAAQFFKRGAIKATLLTVEGNPTPEAKADLKKWWQRVVGGIGNAFSTNVVNAMVKPVIVGEGMQELQDNNLTASKREDISTALGIPQTLLFSTGAGGLGGGGVVGMDDKHFYSKTVVPECDFIAGVFNAQLLSKVGLRMEFQPETLEVFQEDEQQRATAFKTYREAGLPASLIAEMLGLDLPDGWEYADLDPKPKEPVTVQPPPANGAAPPSTNGTQPPGGDVNTEVDAIVAGLTKALEDGGVDWYTTNAITTTLSKALSPVHGNGNDPQDAKGLLDDLPNEIEYEDDAEDVQEKALDDLRKWRRKSQKRGSLAPFESEVIPAHVAAAVKECGFDWLANWQELKAREVKDWVTINGNPVLIGGESAGSSGRSYRVLTSDAEVSAVGDAMYGDLVNKMTGMESPAMQAYTTDERYNAINGALRGDGSGLGANQVIVDNMDSAIAKTSLPEDLTLFRGLNNADDFDFKVGDSFVDKGFASTSLSQKVGESFAPQGRGALLKIRAPKGSKGAFMDGLSEYAEEFEVTLPRGSGFKVTGVGKDKLGRTIIDAELLQ